MKTLPDRLSGLASGASRNAARFAAIVIFVLLLFPSVRAADGSTAALPLPFPTLTNADLHKFILANGTWIYGTLISVGQSTVNMEMWEKDKKVSFKFVPDSSGKGTGIAIKAFSDVEKNYIKNWVAKHPDGIAPAAIPFSPPSPVGILLWPGPFASFGSFRAF